MRRFSRAARIAVLCALAIGAAGASGSSQEPYRPRGRYNNSVHRFFPDLDSRFNAVRYGRWRALEIAWKVGINPELDTEFSAFLLKLLADPPRFPPEAELVAPRFAREAASVFHALHWGQVFETQVSDTLASFDAAAELTAEAGHKIAERSRELATEIRRDQAARGEATASEPSQPSTPAEAASADEAKGDAS